MNRNCHGGVWSDLVLGRMQRARSPDCIVCSEAWEGLAPAAPDLRSAGPYPSPPGIQALLLQPELRAGWAGGTPAATSPSSGTERAERGGPSLILRAAAGGAFSRFRGHGFHAALEDAGSPGDPRGVSPSQRQLQLPFLLLFLSLPSPVLGVGPPFWKPVLSRVPAAQERGVATCHHRGLG